MDLLVKIYFCCGGNIIRFNFYFVFCFEIIFDFIIRIKNIKIYLKFKVVGIILFWVFKFFLRIFLIKFFKILDEIIIKINVVVMKKSFIFILLESLNIK